MFTRVADEEIQVSAGPCEDDKTCDSKPSSSELSHNYVNPLVMMERRVNGV